MDLRIRLWSIAIVALSAANLCQAQVIFGFGDATGAWCSYAHAVSPDGEIAVGQTGTNAFAYNWTDGTTKSLGKLDDYDGAAATGVTNSGNVVGLAADNGNVAYGNGQGWYILDVFDSQSEMTAVSNPSDPSCVGAQCQQCGGDGCLLSVTVTDGVDNGNSVLAVGVGFRGLDTMFAVRWAGGWGRADDSMGIGRFAAGIDSGTSSDVSVGFVDFFHEGWMPTYWVGGSDAVELDIDGHLAGYATGISDDCSVIVGVIYTLDGEMAARWTNVNFGSEGSGTLELLANADEFVPKAVSNDGNTIVGYKQFFSPAHRKAWLWRDGVTPVGCSILSEIDCRGAAPGEWGFGIAEDISVDARVVVGQGSHDVGATRTEGWIVVFPTLWEGTGTAYWTTDANWSYDEPSSANREDSAAVGNGETAIINDDVSAYGLYLGGSTGESGGVDLLSGSLTIATELCIGQGGDGTLDIQSTSAEITLGTGLELGPNATFTISAAFGQITIAPDGEPAYVTITGQRTGGQYHEDLDGLAKLTLNCAFASGSTSSEEIHLEAAGIDDATLSSSDFDEVNFVIDTLVIGSSTTSTAIVNLHLEDDHENQTYAGGRELEAVYVNTLVMDPGAAFHPNYLELYYLNGGSPKRLIIGDMDLDGDVDLDDFNAFKANMGATDAKWSDGDFDGNRVVDLADFVLFKAHFGETT